jgi:malate dehydrogenase (oxaloacetate-decarboxylating)(NADP+)
MKIPVFHDDQHGTAIISGAALLNALEIVKKDISKVRVVFSGAGAAGIACAKLYVRLGIDPQNIITCDSKGVMWEGREEFNQSKREFVRKTSCRTLADAMKDADLFVGVSVANAVTPAMVKSMGRDPIVFAMANPDPEIPYPDAIAARKDVIMATGRSDYPNQINNVLGFPFIFRGALDVMATTINEEMKIAAVHALAGLAKEDVPEEVARVYGLTSLKFGREYIVPKPFDSRVLVREASAVAKAAMDSGVARKRVDIEEYKRQLSERIGKGRVIMNVMTDKAKRDPKRVVFPEATSARILRAATHIKAEGIGKPILVGNPDEVKKAAAEAEVNLEGIAIVDPATSDKREKYGERFYELRQRRGVTLKSAVRQMSDPTYYGMMMLAMGDCDAVLSGVESDYPTTIKPALEIIPLNPGITRVSGLYAMIRDDKVYMFADTTVNIDPTSEELVEIALSATKVARQFNIEPRIAMLSFSNFGSSRYPESEKVAKATALLKQRAPDLIVEGEMQADLALMPEMMKELYPFSKLKQEANVFVFPDLNAANIAYKLLQKMGNLRAVGPILMGLSKPIHVLHRTLDVSDIVDMASIAVVDAQGR